MKNTCAEYILAFQASKKIRKEIDQMVDEYLIIKDNEKSTTTEKNVLLAKLFRSRRNLINAINELAKIFEFDNLFYKKDGQLKAEEIIEMLLYIYEQSYNQKSVSKRELAFLYRLNNYINKELFAIGLQEDHSFNIDATSRAKIKTKISRILGERNERVDLSIISGYPIEQIGIRSDDLHGKKYYYGGLSILREVDYRHVELPDIIDGSLCFRDILAPGGIKLPLFVSNDLIMSNLELAEGVRFPDSVGGYVDLTSLRSIAGLTLPSHVGGEVRMLNLSTDDQEIIEAKYPHLKFEF